LEAIARPQRLATARLEVDIPSDPQSGVGQSPPRLPKTLPPPAPMPSRGPTPRQHIPHITKGLRFLGHPTPSGLPAWSPAPVSGRAPDGFPRSGCPFCVALGRHFTPCPSHRADTPGALNQGRMGTIPVWACLSAALASSNSRRFRRTFACPSPLLGASPPAAGGLSPAHPCTPPCVHHAHNVG